MALVIKANCGKCAQQVEVIATGTPTLQQTGDGWVIVIPADGWDWDLHKMKHTEAEKS